MRGKIIAIIVIVLAVLFIGIQFIPVQRTNPPVLTRLDWDSPQTEELARGACMDCHSNETVWPWYSYVAPVSWLIAHDVHEARGVLNFSELTSDPTQLANITRWIENAIQSGEMPYGPYLLMHSEARLTAEQKQALITGFEKTLANPPLTE
jgi:hypothetical protein